MDSRRWRRRGIGHATPEFYPDPQESLRRSIAKQRYAVPDGESAAALAQELSGLLGSPDPELRDTLAYTILAVWIDRQVLAAPQLLPLLETWLAGLRTGLGDANADSLLTRSFSALCLASLSERDLKTPFLGPARYRALLDAALAYLGAERDLRGYDAAKGWMHATAFARLSMETLDGPAAASRTAVLAALRP